LDYELSAKRDTREAYAALNAEAMGRDDFGVGVMWEPEAGGGIRPAAVYVRGVTALVTADLEMEAVAAANPRLRRSAVEHIVLSVNEEESATLTNAELMERGLAVLDGMGFSEHQMVVSLHRDTDNAHLHCVVGRVNPVTLRAWNNTNSYDNLSWQLREAELRFGMHHDLGRAVYDPDVEGFIRYRTVQEARAQDIETPLHRLEQQARRYLESYLAFEGPETWARDILGPDVLTYMTQAQDRGEALRATDLHAIAADKATRLTVKDDRVFIHIMERLSDEELEAERLRLIAADPTLQKRDAFGEAKDLNILRQREATVVELPVCEFLGYMAGEESQPGVREQVAFLKSLCGVEEAERRFASQLRGDPSLVSRELVAGGFGVFTRDDLFGFIGRRVSDPAEVTSLVGHVEKTDSTLRMLSADTAAPLFTTVSQLELEERVRAQAIELFRAHDARFDPDALERSIAKLEQLKGFTLTAEQRQLLHGVERRLSWSNGDAGSGKTVCMRGLQLYAAETDRRVIGLSLSEKAARELGAAANVKSLNIAKALASERHGKRVFRKGDVMVIDETSMVGHRQLDALFQIALERECTVFGIGDKAQLPPIEAGFAHDVVMEVAQANKAFTELTIVRRQTGELAFMAYDSKTKSKGLVRELGQAIREDDRDGVTTAVEQFGERGLLQACTDRDVAIAEGVDFYLSALQAKLTALLLAGDRLTCRHLTARLRDLIGTAGKGDWLLTARNGLIELSVGDRIAFLKNDSNLGGHGVDNGDLGTVKEMHRDLRTRRWSVTVDADLGHQLTFDPESYRDFSHGFALTVMKAEGSMVDCMAGVIDKTASAQLFHVMASRARRKLRFFYSKANFPEESDLVGHIADRIQLKPDPLLFEAIVAKTGGPDTVWATRVRQAMARETDPLRIRHKTFTAAQQERFSKDSVRVHERVRGQMKSAADASEVRRLQRAVKKEIAALRKRYPLLTFVVWAARERDGIEREVAYEHKMRDFARYSQESHTINEPQLRTDDDEQPALDLKLA
jgi:ATP-dependent exoDNAse (exonuclease V) alpha subunit